MKFRLRTKISISILSIIVLGTILISYQVNKNIFEAQEHLLQEFTNARTTELENILTLAKKDLEHQIYAYTRWDQFYDALEKEDAQWLKENGTEVIFNDPACDLDIIYLWKTEGNYYEYYGEEFLKRALINSEFIKEGKKKNKSYSDFVVIEGDLYLLGIAPVTPQDQSRSSGFYIMGKRLNQQEFQRFLKSYSLGDFERIDFVDDMNSKDTIVDKDLQLTVHYPIKDNKQNVLQNTAITFDMKIYLKSLNMLYPHIAKTIILVGSLVVVALLCYMHGINKTIYQIIQEVNIISKGDYSHRITKTDMKELNDLAEYTHELTETIKNKIKDLEKAHLDTVHILIRVIEAKDPYTRGHSERVNWYAEIIGQQLKVKDIEFLKKAALLHDIGKIGLREDILNKKGRLTEEEYEMVKQHSGRGYDILMGSKALDDVKDIVRHHHERYDGRGYPDRLQCEEIELEARIIAIADTFDAVTSDRPYRKGMSFEKAVEIIQKESGTQFDPKVVDAFMEVCSEIREICEKSKTE